MSANRPRGHRVIAMVVVAMAVSSLSAIESQERAPRPPTAVQQVPASTAARALRDGERIDLNRATVSELRLLPRVGPVLAERIAAHRPYQDVSDLTRVSGIGPKTLSRLRSWVKVDPP